MSELDALRAEVADLRLRLADAEQALLALSRAEVDAVAEQPGSAPVLLRAAQEQLLQSERLLRAIFDGALDAVLLVDDDGVYRDANPAACALFALPKPHLLGRRVVDFAETLDDVAWQQLLRTGRLEGEFRLLRPDGERRDLDFRATANILPGLHMSVLRDVTERRRAEIRFRALIEKSSDLILLSDADSVIGYASPSALRMLGYEPEDLLGKRVSELMHPDDRGGSADNARVGEAGGEIVGLECRILHHDGSWRWVEATVRSLLADAAVQAVVSNFRDITDRKQGLETQARLAAIVESSEDAIISEDLAEVITTWNRGAERLFQWSAVEAIGQPTALLIPQELLGQERRTLQLARSGEQVDQYETRRRRKDGAIVHVSVTTSLLRDSLGAVTGASRIARDVTAQRQTEAALRQTEQQLRHAQKMEAIGVLAGGVAHDFNNLLSVVVSYAVLLQSELEVGNPMRRDIEEIRLAGERATKLTRQLLAFSRRQVLDPQVLDLRQVVAGMEQMLKRLISEDIELSLPAAAPVGRVFADASQIEQVVMNLVVNAGDAMPHGGKLTIETATVELDDAYARVNPGVKAGSYVMLAVTDTGTGMDAATRERIFEPFFTTKERGKGTGIGLSTVFGIVQQSEGHLRVHSEPGKGTTFQLYFPLTEQAPLSRRSLPPAVGSLHGNETILVVEDDEHVRVLTRTILGRQGYLVLDSQNAGEAFLLCEKHPGPIDLLLTDVVMPRMGGRELARRLAPMKPGMKVLYTSGHAESSKEQHQLPDTALFLAKPITPDALLRKVREVLDAS